MTDAEPAGVPISTGDPTLAPGGPQVRVLTQFVRDLSFENPRAPESLRSSGTQPNIEIGVEMNARTRTDDLYEVDLKLSAAAHVNNEAIFVVELVYGGLFQVTGVPEENMEPLLLIECPRFLFPFARRVVADLTAEGGFPPFMLDPIDFAAIYTARRAQAQAQGQFPAQSVGQA
jgi:preprotein translocase subunit SecB